MFPEFFDRKLTQLGGTGIHCEYGGNGVETNCKKPMGN